MADPRKTECETKYVRMCEECGKHTKQIDRSLAFGAGATECLICHSINVGDRCVRRPESGAQLPPEEPEHQPEPEAAGAEGPGPDEHPAQDDGHAEPGPSPDAGHQDYPYEPRSPLHRPGIRLPTEGLSLERLVHAMRNYVPAPGEDPMVSGFRSLLRRELCLIGEELLAAAPPAQPAPAKPRREVAPVDPRIPEYPLGRRIRRGWPKGWKRGPDGKPVPPPGWKPEQAQGAPA